MSPPLKYIFKCLFLDNTLIEQNVQDISTLTPGKNCFYDVLQNIHNVRAFGLYDNFGHAEYLVDLSDGHFEVNKQTFWLHDPSVDITNKRLIYFRSREILPQLNLDRINSYNFGWQGNLPNGENIKRIITLN